MAKKKEYWRRKDVCEILGITKASIKFFIEAGAPAEDKEKGGFPAIELCQFLVARPRKSRGPDKTDIRQRAQNYLMANGADVPPAGVRADAKKVPEQNESAIEKKAGRPKKLRAAPCDLEPGMKRALERAREAEVMAYKIYADGLNKTGVISVAHLDAWQKTLNNLRSCETDFGKAMERQRELVETKEVQDWLEPMIQQTKTMLLNLPSKLAPSLEGLQWYDIQERLDKEIRDVIGKLANFS